MWEYPEESESIYVKSQTFYGSRTQFSPTGMPLPNDAEGAENLEGPKKMEMGPEDFLLIPEGKRKAEEPEVSVKRQELNLNQIEPQVQPREDQSSANQHPQICATDLEPPVPVAPTEPIGIIKAAEPSQTGTALDVESDSSQEPGRLSSLPFPSHPFPTSPTHPNRRPTRPCSWP